MFIFWPFYIPIYSRFYPFYVYIYIIIYVLAPVEKLVAWKTENQMSCAELWIEFFEHYSLGITSTDNIISVRSTANCTKEDRQWKGKKMAIEDPFSTKRSLTR